MRDNEVTEKPPVTIAGFVTCSKNDEDKAKGLLSRLPGYSPLGVPAGLQN